MTGELTFRSVPNWLTKVTLRSALPEATEAPIGSVSNRGPDGAKANCLEARTWPFLTIVAITLTDSVLVMEIFVARPVGPK